MRNGFAWLILFIAIPAAADPLPADAYDRTVSDEDVRRLTKMMFDRSRSAPRTPSLYSLRQENSERLRRELYAASPALAIVERLHRHEQELRREDMEQTDRFAEQFYRSLIPEDRLKYMKMIYRLPVQIHLAPGRRPAEGK
jgi:hypothetical protein